jgi:Zn-dependent peptidase ImmA (M78 family)
MTPPRMTADRIIKELGISEPADIDIEAIAQYCGATIVYEKLTGCEARIVGNADRAIITVNSDSRRGRQRFSAAHELGHWMHDRNHVGFSCTNVLFRSQWGAVNPEEAANEFAADLLLPQAIFGRYSYASPVTFESVRDLAVRFETSLAATAIRLVKYGSFPAMVIYLAQGVRKWFVAGPDVPSALWPREIPSLDTIAGELLRGASASSKPQGVQADGWITHPGSQWYELVEDSVRFRDGSILSLLWWKNEKQIVDLMNDD